MIHAYNELYLNDAIRLLSNAFDYAINDCKIDADQFSNNLMFSDLISQFEVGNPYVIAGKSSIELVKELLTNIDPKIKLPPQKLKEKRTPEYWAGWALAQYQWEKAKKFKDIFGYVSLKEIISMYPLYHEMDISSFIEALDNKLKDNKHETKLHKIRIYRGLSQSELATQSSVNLRSIQLYEQKINNIDKAQVHTLFKLATVLGCKIEDLLENPQDII